jgi:acyl-CoA thioester hydrolase
MSTDTTAQGTERHTVGGALSAPPPVRPGLPSVAEVLALGNGIRRTAPRDWEDENGHVNVAHHYAFHMDASIAVFAQLGMTADYLDRHGQSTFTIEQHLNFYDEVLVGHEVSGHLRLLDVNAKLVHGISVMVNHTTGRVVNTVEFVEGHVDLATRRTTPWQPALAEALQAALARHDQLPWSLPLNGSMGLR